MGLIRVTCECGIQTDVSVRAGQSRVKCMRCGRAIELGPPSDLDLEPESAGDVGIPGPAVSRPVPMDAPVPPRRPPAEWRRAAKSRPLEPGPGWRAAAVLYFVKAALTAGLFAFLSVEDSRLPPWRFAYDLAAVTVLTLVGIGLWRHAAVAKWVALVCTAIAAALLMAGALADAGELPTGPWPFVVGGLCGPVGLALLLDAQETTRKFQIGLGLGIIAEVTIIALTLAGPPIR